MDTPLVCLAGPTAVGKSDLALLLAERLKGEIISVDSMQVYRGMDIGTAKPSREERERVPHHLLDIRDLDQPFDAAQFVNLAKTASAEIRGRGRVPILCGGTGLYFKAYLEGLGEAPPSDPALRKELVATGLEALLSELAESDPLTFARIDRANPRRVIRAIEVIRLTGRPYSAQRADWTRPQSAWTSAPTSVRVCLSRSAGNLQRRIDQRVDAMFANGLILETRRLLESGLERNIIAMQALGYRQVVEHLRGLRNLAETIALVKIRTRQFAKRQMTWFRRQLPFEMTTLTPESDLASLADQLANRFG